MKRGTTRLKFILLITLFVLIFYGISRSELVQEALANPEALRSFILSLGILAPLGIILLQAFQTTISIVPSQLIIIFSVARSYGRKIAGIFFDESELLHFTLFFKEKKLLALFLARLAPIFPNDLVSFTAGLSPIKIWQFNLISTAGFVVQMILLTYFGAELSTGEFSIPLLSISLVVSLLLLLFLFKEDVHRILIGDFRLLKKERKVIKERIAKELRKIRL